MNDKLTIPDWREFSFVYLHEIIKKQAPEEPGHYLFVGPTYNDIYCGSTKNLKQRLPYHEIIKEFKSSEILGAYYKTCHLTKKERIEIETALINKCDPMIRNKNQKDKERRKEKEVEILPHLTIEEIESILEKSTINELRKLATQVNMDVLNLLPKYFDGPYATNKKKVWVSALLDHFRREKRLAKVG